MCKMETDVHRRAKLSWATQSPFNLIISEAPIANLQGDCSGDYEDWISEASIVTWLSVHS